MSNLKKLLLGLLSVICAGSLMAFAACDESTDVEIPGDEIIEEETPTDTETETPSDTETEATCAHSYASEVTKEATCYSKGETTYTCSLCGDVYTESITYLDHVWDEGVVTEATCTESGYTTKTCSLCEDTAVTDYTNPLGHDWSDATVVEATCTTTGTSTKTCNTCKEEDSTTIAVIGHSYVNNACKWCNTTVTSAVSSADFEALIVDGTDTVNSNSNTSDINTFVLNEYISYLAKSDKSAIKEDNGVYYINCGGKTTASAGYCFSLDLSAFAGTEVTITVVFAANASSDRSAYFTTAMKTPSSDAATTLAYATSSSQTDYQTLTYTFTVNGIESTDTDGNVSVSYIYYITFDASVNIYSVTINGTPNTSTEAGDATGEEVTTPAETEDQEVTQDDTTLDQDQVQGEGTTGSENDNTQESGNDDSNSGDGSNDNQSGDGADNQ